MLCLKDRVWKTDNIFHFKSYMRTLSEFRIDSVLLAVLPLSFHVPVFPKTHIFQSSGSQNTTQGVCWDHRMPNNKGKNLFIEWYSLNSKTTCSGYTLSSLAEAGTSLCHGFLKLFFAMFSVLSLQL